MADLSIDNHGSIFIVYGESPEGQEWMEQHLPADAQHFAGGVAVEHRFIDPIIDGALADGLVLA